MSEKIQRQKTSTPKTDDVAQETTAVAGTSDKLKADIDDLLDEIDGVLETNAEEFVKSYVQKGGQ